MPDGVAGPLNWANTPEVSSADWHRRPGGKEWRYDRRGIYLRQQPDTPVRSRGEPATCKAILAAYGTEIFGAAVKYKVPPELIVMTIATETGMYRSCNFTGPRTFRWESNVSDYSAGPMQLLSATARDVIDRVPVECAPDDIPPRYAAKPVPNPFENALYDGELNINIGTAYIAQNAAKRNTGLDPILVAACYNAGSLRDSNKNEWGLVTFGDHLDRASQWFGDACALLAELRAGGRVAPADPAAPPPPEDQVEEEKDEGDDDDTYDELHNLTPEAAKKWADFYKDSGAEVDWIDQQSGLVTLIATYKRRPKPPAAPKNINVPDPEQDGYVFCINRVRTQKRADKQFARTVGFYQAFFNRVALPEISGMAVERQGPGDNTSVGVSEHRRLKAGTYPLLTHQGGSGKYCTYGYVKPGALKRRPWPSIRIGNTGTRSGVLIHCAAGYLMSIGCINLTGRLANARSNIEFADSHTRVTALIRSMRDKLGADFPQSNNQTIRGATLLIRNEP